MASLADRLVSALAEAGATTLFGLPGGGPNLDVVGAALDQNLNFVLAHGENAAAIMASTHGLLTRAPSPVVVTRGPGATSVTNGVAQATLDRYPLVVITDTVSQADRDRVAHQRIDQRALFAPIAKLTGRLGSDVESQTLQRVVSTSSTWPFGATHVDYDAASKTDIVVPVSPTNEGGEDAAALEMARARLADARSPLVIIGMEAAALGGSNLAASLEAAGLPVLSTYQAIGLVPTESDIWAGLFTNGLLERPVLDAADLVILIGLDIVEPIPAPWPRDVPIIAVSTSDVGLVSGDVSPYFPSPDVVIRGNLHETVPALLPPAIVDASDWTATSGATFRDAARGQISASTPEPSFGPVELVQTAAASLPAGTITTVDAGAHFLAVMPLWPTARPFELLISNGLATMGFALPAAIGASLARPATPVLALTGDGGLGMALAELETLVRLALPITVVVFNDSTLSLIKIKQQPQHGGRRAVGYGPTNFAAIAEANGLAARIVSTADELAEALTGGWEQPRLIDARIDPADYSRLIAATRG